jgi:hypothetical protein
MAYRIAFSHREALEALGERAGRNVKNETADDGISQVRTIVLKKVVGPDRLKAK